MRAVLAPPWLFISAASGRRMQLPRGAEGEEMKDVTKILLSLSAVLAAVAQVPAVQAGVAAFVAAHPSIAAVGGLLTFVGGLLYQPKSE